MTETYAEAHAPHDGMRPHYYLPADALAPGDWIRDRGRMRAIAHIEAAGIMGGLVMIYFERQADDEDEQPPHLAVPARQRVTVWRAA
jgi:hypothetical protein